MTETPEQFRERMRSVGFVGSRRFIPHEKIVTRPERDPSGNQTDAGQRARMTISDSNDVVLTTSDNRQDVKIFGVPAVAGSAGGEPE